MSTCSPCSQTRCCFASYNLVKKIFRERGGVKQRRIETKCRRERERQDFFFCAQKCPYALSIVPRGCLTGRSVLWGSRTAWKVLKSIAPSLFSEGSEDASHGRGGGEEWGGGGERGVAGHYGKYFQTIGWGFRTPRSLEARLCVTQLYLESFSSPPGLE